MNSTAETGLKKERTKAGGVWKRNPSGHPRAQQRLGLGTEPALQGAWGSAQRADQLQSPSTWEAPGGQRDRRTHATTGVAGRKDKATERGGERKRWLETEAISDPERNRGTERCNNVETDRERRRVREWSG